MSAKAILFLRRALFAQPLGVTLRDLRAKVRRKGRPQGPASGQPFVHPVDVQYGTDTGGQISAMKLATGRPSDVFNVGYIGSQPSVIRQVLEEIPADLKDATFVDIGCGKGRPLVVATEFPFRRIVGVEINDDLAEIARTNA